MTYTEKWKHLEPQIQNCITNNPGREVRELASIISVSTFVPVLECCYILQERFGTSELLEQNIESLKRFYNR